MSMGNLAAQYVADRRHEVKIDTWGDLAPQKNIKYPIEFVCAVGYFSEDYYNPVLVSIMGNDDPFCGPWFYESVREFMSDRLGSENNSGKLFHFIGHWSNYRFVGKFKPVSLPKFSTT